MGTPRLARTAAGTWIIAIIVAAMWFVGCSEGDYYGNTGDGPWRGTFYSPTTTDCCDEGDVRDYSRCWSSCESKTVLPPEECKRCLNGERECVWPWEIDVECINE